MGKKTIEEEPTDVEEEVEDEIEDEIIDHMEDEKEIRDDINESPSDIYGAPSEQEQHNLHSFLSGLLKAEDRVKTSYLTIPELGKPAFSVRFWLNIASYCQLKNLDLVAAYAYQKAKNTTDSGLSREGFIINTSVTQKKVRTRGRDKIIREEQKL